MASPVMIDEEFYPGRVEFFPERRGCCTCELRDKVERLRFRVAELEREIADLKKRRNYFPPSLDDIIREYYED